MGLLRAVVLAAAVSVATAEAEARVDYQASVNALFASHGSGGRRLETYNGLAELCGVDLGGRDLSSRRFPNPDTCAFGCVIVDGCDAVTWTNYEGGTCWFKSVSGSLASAVPKAGAISFVRQVDALGCFGVPVETRANTDMPGNDLANRPAANASNCRDLCAANTKCFAFTWTNYQGGTCWLKSKATAFVANSGATSGYVARTADFSLCLP